MTDFLINSLKELNENEKSKAPVSINPPLPPPPVNMAQRLKANNADTFGMEGSMRREVLEAAVLQKKKEQPQKKKDEPPAQTDPAAFNALFDKITRYKERFPEKLQSVPSPKYTDTMPKLQALLNQIHNVLWSMGGEKFMNTWGAAGARQAIKIIARMCLGFEAAKPYAALLFDLPDLFAQEYDYFKDELDEICIEYVPHFRANPFMRLFGKVMEMLSRATETRKAQEKVAELNRSRAGEQKKTYNKVMRV